MIKFAVLRTGDGHATDPLLPKSKVAAGVAGYFEVLTTGKADAIRVKVAGEECPGGRMPVWAADREPGKVAVTIEQIAGGQVVDTKTGEVTVVGPDNSPPADPEPPTE